MGVGDIEAGSGVMADLLPFITATQGNQLTTLVNLLYSRVKSTSHSERYEKIPVQNLITNNCQSSEGLSNLRNGLKCLERYCRNLVPPEAERHQHWRTIMTSNLAFCNKIKPVQGATEILMTLGYTEVKSDRILFPEDKSISSEETKELLAELVMGHYELELYLTGKHPNATWIDQRVPAHVKVAQCVSIEDMGQSPMTATAPKSHAQHQILHSPDEPMFEPPSVDAQKLPGVAELKSRFENDKFMPSDIKRSEDHVKKPFVPQKLGQSRMVFFDPKTISTEQKTQENSSAMLGGGEGASAFSSAAGSASTVGSNQALASEAMDVESQEEEGSCHVCGDVSKGMWFCTDCNKTLCENCNVVYHRHSSRSSHKPLKRQCQPERNEQPRKKRQASGAGLFTAAANVAHPPPVSTSAAAVNNISPFLVTSRSSSGLLPDLSTLCPSTVSSGFSMPPPPETQNESISAHHLESDETTAERRFEKQHEQIVESLSEIAEKEKYYDQIMMKLVSTSQNFHMDKEYIDARNKRNEMTKLRQELEEKKTRLTTSSSSGELLLGASSEKVILCKCGVYSAEGYCRVCQEKDGKLAQLLDPASAMPGGAIASANVSPPTSLPEISPVKKPWKCSNCLHMNSKDSLSCEACVSPQSTATATEQRKVCPFFNRPSGCRFGERCFFQHIAGAREPCYFHQQPGGCKKGDSCPFLHDDIPHKAEASNTVDIGGVQLDFGKVTMGKDGASDGMQQALNQQRNALDDIVKIAAQQQQEDVLVQNARIANRLRLAEQAGFSLEELNMAPTYCGSVEPMDWLNDTWLPMVDALVVSTGLSQDEIKRGLLMNKLDKEAATTAAQHIRNRKVKTLSAEGSFSEEQIADALKKSQGDADIALDALTSRMLSELKDNIHLGLTKDSTPQPSTSSSDVYNIDAETEVVMRTEANEQRRIRIALIEGELQGWLRAENMIKLIDELDTMQNIDISDIVSSVRQFGALEKCKKWLQFECSVCLENYPEYKMHTMFICDDKFCRGCLTSHYTVKIKENDVNDFGCPQCKLPNFYSNDPQERERMHTYLQMFDTQMRFWLEPDVFAMYQMKVTQWNLQQDQDFRWCSFPDCQNGFLYQGFNRRMTCPKCQRASCSECKKPWEAAHDGIDCQQFAQWQIDNDPAFQEAGLTKILEESGINCPHCKFRYQLAKGGCMHFTCLKCNHQFCSGCYQQMSRSAIAGLSAKHPRDCLYYLRDYDVDVLIPLLRNNNIQFQVEPPQGSNHQTCQVMEQKEIGLQEEACGKPIQQNHAGLCKLHYQEYIVSLINKNRIDPVSIMEEHRVRRECEGHGINIPNKAQGEADAAYLDKIRQMLQTGAPLPARMY